MSLTSPTHESDSLEKNKMASPNQVTKTETIEEGEHDASSLKMGEEAEFVPDLKLEKKLIRKIDMMTVPMMILIYFLS